MLLSAESKLCLKPSDHMTTEPCCWFLNSLSFSLPLFLLHQMQGVATAASAAVGDSDSEHQFIEGTLPEAPSPAAAEPQTPMDADKSSIYQYTQHHFHVSPAGGSVSPPAAEEHFQFRPDSKDHHVTQRSLPPSLLLSSFVCVRALPPGTPCSLCWRCSSRSASSRP